jgi:hypothetical protein
MPAADPLPMPAPAALPEPEVRPNDARWRGRLIVGLVALLMIAGALVVAASIDWLGVGLGSSSAPTDRTAGGGAGASETSTSPAPTAAQSEAAAASERVDFDLEPLGPLADDAARIGSVLGNPEVAAVPTSFDRSLRLARRGDGACFEGAPGKPVRALVLDVRADQRAAGRIRIGPSASGEGAVTLAMADVEGVVADAWYRVRVASTGDGQIRLVVRERSGGSVVHRVDATAASLSGPTVCVRAVRASGTSDLHVDNVRVQS